MISGDVSPIETNLNRETRGSVAIPCGSATCQDLVVVFARADHHPDIEDTGRMLPLVGDINEMAPQRRSCDVPTLSSLLAVPYVQRG